MTRIDDRTLSMPIRKRIAGARDRGITTIELLVGMVLTAILGALALTFLSTASNATATQSASQAQDAATLDAVNQITRDVGYTQNIIYANGSDLMLDVFVGGTESAVRYTVQGTTLTQRTISGFGTYPASPTDASWSSAITRTSLRGLASSATPFSYFNSSGTAISTSSAALTLAARTANAISWVHIDISSSVPGSPSAARLVANSRPRNVSSSAAAAGATAGAGTDCVTPTIANVGGHPQLTWTLIPGALGYEVDRNSATLTIINQPSGSQSQLTYTDVSAAQGIDASYTVLPIENGVAETACSSTAWVSPPAAPTVTGQVNPLTALVTTMPSDPWTASGAPTQPVFQLSWPAVPRATAYSVYRQGANGVAGGEVTYAITGAAATQVDANGQIVFTWGGDAQDSWQSDYTWTVTASSSAGSGVPAAGISLSSHPNTPTGVKAIPSLVHPANGPTSGTNSISWIAPANTAGTGGYHQGALAGYSIWSQAVNGSWNQVGSVGAGTTSYNDANVALGSTTIYAVSARDTVDTGESQVTQGLFSPLSAKVTALQYPSAPVLSAASQVIGANTLSWAALNGGATLTLYHSTSTVNSPTVQVTSGLTSSSSSVTETAGSLIQYRATAVNVTGSSDPSSIVSFQQAPPAPTVSACASAASVGGVTCTAGAFNVNQVDAWFASGVVTNATGERVYRSLASTNSQTSPAVDMSVPVLQSTDPGNPGYVTPTADNATASGALAVSDTGRELASYYRYAVASCNTNLQTNAIQCGPASTTNTVLQYPVAATAVAGYPQSAGVSDQASWSSIAGITGYKLFRSSDLSSCFTNNGSTMTTADPNAMTTQIQQDGSLGTTTIPAGTVTATNIAAGYGTCYAFSVQGVNATGGGPRSPTSPTVNQTSYALEYSPVVCTVTASASAGHNNYVTVAYTANGGSCPASLIHTREHQIYLFRMTSGGVVTKLAVYPNDTPNENQTSVQLLDTQSIAGNTYTYAAQTCDEIPGATTYQCTPTLSAYSAAVTTLN